MPSLIKLISNAILNGSRAALDDERDIAFTEYAIADLVEDVILCMDYVPNPKRTQAPEKSPLQGIAEAMRRAVPGGLIPMTDEQFQEFNRTQLLRSRIEQEYQSVPRSTANEVQVGGDHYRTNGKYQIWDLVVDMGWDFFQGNVISYVHRYRQKGGVGDLRKARHYLDKMIEIEEAKKSEGEKS